MCQSIEVVLANPKVKALLITLIGGLTRMDEMAEGSFNTWGNTSHLCQWSSAWRAPRKR